MGKHGDSAGICFVSEMTSLTGHSFSLANFALLTGASHMDSQIEGIEETGARRHVGKLARRHATL